MANYFTGFTEYSAGSIPSDWTERWDASGQFKVQTGGDNQTLKATIATNNRYLCSWNAVDADANRDNTEILVLLQTLDVTAAQVQAGCVIRGSGTGTTENGYSSSIYGTNLIVSKYVNATFTAITNVTLTLAANTWYYMRFRVNGASLRSKIWAKAAAEPAAWTIDTTDSSVAGVGWAGALGFYNLGDPEFEKIGIATNGETAIVVAELSAATAINITATTVTPQVAVIY